MHGTYEKRAERPTLEFERRLDHPAGAVWTAITEPAELEHWFPTKVEVDLRPGGEMLFRFEDTPIETPPTMPGRVTDLDPPRLFAFDWGEDHLRFELEPTGGGRGCLLRLTVILGAEDKAARDAAGWHLCLDGLEERLAGPAAKRPFSDEVWRAHYDEYSRRGLPTGAEIPSSDLA